MTPVKVTYFLRTQPIFGLPGRMLLLAQPIFFQTNCADKPPYWGPYRQIQVKNIELIPI